MKTKPPETPETDKLVRETLDNPQIDTVGFASRLTMKCMDMEIERNVAREKAEFWRSQYAKLSARNSCEYEQQVETNKLPWEKP